MTSFGLPRGFRDQVDWPLLTAVAAIVVFGLVNLYSASSVALNAQGLFVSQLYRIVLGIGAAVFAATIDYRHFERYAWWLYGFGVVLLLLVFLLGQNVRGSTRWIDLGFIAVQPSELMKPLLIVALARYLSNDPKTEGRSLFDLFVTGMIVGLPMTLILLQPDLGTALICAFIFGSVMLLTNLRLWSVLALALVFVLSAPITWVYLLKEYQRERISAFFNPHADLLDSGWHAHQSIVAIGSGGLTGEGFLQGTQNQFHFLPDAHSDFPFAVWAEEQGFLGVALMLGLYLFLVLWALKIASLAKDRFGAVLAVGLAALFFWHSVINVGMVVGLLPVVGITLPLFSYGGSSVVTMLFGVGLLMNVSVRR